MSLDEIMKEAVAFGFNPGEQTEINELYVHEMHQHYDKYDLSRVTASEACRVYREAQEHATAATRLYMKKSIDTWHKK